MAIIFEDYCDELINWTFSHISNFAMDTDVVAGVNGIGLEASGSVVLGGLFGASTNTIWARRSLPYDESYDDFIITLKIYANYPNPSLSPLGHMSLNINRDAQDNPFGILLTGMNTNNLTRVAAIVDGFAASNKDIDIDSIPSEIDVAIKKRNQLYTIEIDGLTVSSLISNKSFVWGNNLVLRWDVTRPDAYLDSFIVPIANLKHLKVEGFMSGRLSGTVTDTTTELPISGADVTYGSQSTTTGTDGSYSFTNADETGNLTVSYENYVTQAISDVYVEYGSTVVQNVALAIRTRETVEIWTAQDLRDIGNSMDTSYTDYVQMADIDLGGWGNWEPICGTESPPFQGTYDGQNFSIDNLYSHNDDGASLFDEISSRSESLISAEIKNLVFNSPNIISDDTYAAVLASYVIDCVLENITINDATVESTYEYSSVGILCGDMYEHCTVKGITITNATLTGADAGLLCATAYGLNTENCQASGTIAATRNVGGFIGSFFEDGTIKKCSTDVTVMSNIDSYMSAGGFVGVFYSENNVSLCSSKGTIASSSVGGGEFVGGFFGADYGSGTIEECFSTVDITGDAEECGGFAGFPEGSIYRNCYARGNVASTNENALVGGFAGAITDTLVLENCYSIGKPTGSTTGGFVGGLWADPELTYCPTCYYDSETSECSDIGKGVPKTTAEMKNVDTFAEWDFMSVWGIDEGSSYPYFRWSRLNCIPPIIVLSAIRCSEPIITLLVSTPSDAVDWLLHFRIAAYSDAGGTLLISQVDSSTTPELFEYSTDGGLTWLAFPITGLPRTAYGSQVRSRVVVGPRTQVWLKASVGAESV